MAGHRLLTAAIRLGQPLMATDPMSYVITARGSGPINWTGDAERPNRLEPPASFARVWIKTKKGRSRHRRASDGRAPYLRGLRPTDFCRELCSRCSNAGDRRAFLPARAARNGGRCGDPGEACGNFFLERP